MAVIALDRGRDAERRMLSGRRRRKATAVMGFNHTGPDSSHSSYSERIARIRRDQNRPEEEL